MWRILHTRAVYSRGNSPGSPLSAASELWPEIDLILWAKPDSTGWCVRLVDDLNWWPKSVQQCSVADWQQIRSRTGLPKAAGADFDAIQTCLAMRKEFDSQLGFR